MRRMESKEGRSGDLSSPLMGAKPVYVAAKAQIMMRSRLWYVDDVRPEDINALWFETIDRLAGALNLTEPE